jgi:hypothetical protein
MDRTACTEPQCLYKCEIYLYFLKKQNTLIHNAKTKTVYLCTVDINAVKMELYMNVTFQTVRNADTTHVSSFASRV